jgi:hypothetical protein
MSFANSEFVDLAALGGYKRVGTITILREG